MYSRQYLSTSGQKTYTGTKSKCNCLACMKPCGLFFAQRKSPPKWALQLSSFSIRCGAGCLPVSRRQSTDDSQCAKKTYQTGNAPPHRGIHHTKNLTSDETRFNALYGSTTYCNFYSHVKYSPLASSVRVIYVAFCCYTAPDIQPFFD